MTFVNEYYKKKRLDSLVKSLKKIKIMKFYDIHGTEIKDGDTVKMGDPVYAEIPSNYNIKKINGILHDRPENHKEIPYYKDISEKDSWHPMDREMDQQTLNICEAEIVNLK